MNSKNSIDIPQFKIDTKYLRTLLDEMIEINSVVGDEKDLAILLAEELQKLGLAIQLEDVEANRPNIYAHHHFAQKGKTLTLNGHLDTVDVCEGWTFEPFIPIEKDGNLYGLGSADMKGGLACQIAAIKALVDSNESQIGTIHFSAVVDEEGYGKGGRKMMDNPFFGKGKTDGIIIAEPLFGNTVANSLPLGMTGKVLYKISVKGLSAHAFRPEQGINAITEASKIVNAIENLGDSSKNGKLRFTLLSDDDFGKGSFCVLKIEGGYKKYSVVVPEHCEIILNRLTVPGETKESVIQDLEQLIEKLNLKSKVIIELVPPFYYPYKISEDHTLFSSLKSAYKESMSEDPYTSYMRMITDANIFMGEGKIPTVHFGPKGNNLHSPDENVNVNSLEVCAKIYAQTYYIFQEKNK